MKNMYKVKGIFDLADYCLVSKSSLVSFLSSNKDCKEIVVFENSGEFVLRMEEGIFKDCKQPELLQEMENLDEPNPPGTCHLFEFIIRVFGLEKFLVFSSNQEQALNDFSDWCIFEPLTVTQLS